MDKLFLDTNYLLDVALSERPESEQAAQLFEKILNNEVVGIVCASSLKDFYCIAKHDIDEALERRWLELFNNACYVPAMDQTVVTLALDSDEPDFEDALLRAVAELERADFIISRDIKGFINSQIPKITSTEYLSNS